MSYFIIADLIVVSYLDTFKLNNATRDEVIDIIKKYSKDLKKSVKLSLMSHFDINKRKFMNGKVINHIFKL